jgi:adenylate cyclase
MPNESSPDRTATVLFADVSGSTKLYETVGDRAAMQAIDNCLARMRQSAESSGGRVVKTVGHQILVVFGTPDDAAAASCHMQAAIEALPPVAGTQLGVQIGFHCGSVMQQGDDVFGDTVNIAARLASTAVAGQTVTSSDTAAELGRVYRAWTRRLYPIQIKGKAEAVELCELVWRADEDVTAFPSGAPRERARLSVLRLAYRGQTLVRRRQNETVLLGRDAGCDLVIADDRASRRHCTIERRQDKFVLADHSTNGTYVTAQGEKEIVLRREQLILMRRGWITFGQPRAASQDAVEFSCD